MTRSDKILYHQIHPLKLGTDIIAAIVSLYFFWQDQLLLGLVVHIAPPIIASALVISLVDLEPQRQSALGQYIKRSMSHTKEAIRLVGDIVMVFGAWYRSWGVVLLGLLIVIGAWFSGKLKIGKTCRQDASESPIDDDPIDLKRDLIARQDAARLQSL